MRFTASSKVRVRTRFDLCQYIHPMASGPIADSCKCFGICCVIGVSLLVYMVARTAGRLHPGHPAAAVPADGADGRGGGRDVPVTVAGRLPEGRPVEVQVIGNVEAYSTISVKAQVGGQLTKVSFQREITSRPATCCSPSISGRSKPRWTRPAPTWRRIRPRWGRPRPTWRATRRRTNTRGECHAQCRVVQSGVVSKDQSEQLRAAADASSQALAADQAAIESATANIGASNAGHR